MNYKMVMHPIKPEYDGKVFIKTPKVPFVELGVNALKKSKKDYAFIKYQFYNPATKKYEFKNLRAYKMVFAQGNWYLVIHSDDKLNNGVKFLRLNFIKSINVKKTTFKKDKEILEFLKTFQSLMSEFGAKKQEVIVFVDKEVQRYFKVKKFLNSQTILKETNDGLIIRYYITGENEILFLAKEWLPHMKILSPTSLQNKLQSLINEFLKDKK